MRNYNLINHIASNPDDSISQNILKNDYYQALPKFTHPLNVDDKINEVLGYNQEFKSCEQNISQSGLLCDSSNSSSQYVSSTQPTLQTAIQSALQSTIPSLFNPNSIQLSLQHVCIILIILLIIFIFFIIKLQKDVHKLYKIILKNNYDK